MFYNFVHVVTVCIFYDLFSDKKSVLACRVLAKNRY